MTKTDKLPSCGQWLHEIKHGGFSHHGRAEIDLFVTAITRM